MNEESSASKFFRSMFVLPSRNVPRHLAGILSVWLFAMLVLLSSTAEANRYRSKQTGLANALTTWEVSLDGGLTWANATQLPSQGTTDSVYVRDAHTVTVNASTVNPVMYISVGEGTSGTLLMGVTGTTAFTWAVSGNVDVNTGGTFTVDVNSNATHTMTSGGGLTNNGTISLRPDVNSLCNFTFTGASSSINGNSIQFAGITINDNVNVTLSGTHSANSLIFVAGANNSSLTHNGTGTLNISGNVTVNQPNAGTNITKAWNINAGSSSVTGTLTVGGTNATSTRVAKVVVTTGSLSVTGTTTFTTGTSNAVAQISVGTGSLTFSSALTQNTGTLAFTGAGTMNFSNAYSFASGGTATPVFTTVAGANINFGGSVTVSATGGLTLNATSNETFTATGTLTATTAASFGNVTINNGVTVTGAGVSTRTIVGNLTLNSGATLAGTAVTLSGANKTIDGTGTISAPTTVSANHTIPVTASLTISGAMTINAGIIVTNNGTVTVSSLLSTGTWTQGTNATLNYSGATIAPTLTASANPNTVNYSLGGAQTIKGPTTYHHLTLSGSGAKTAGGALTVNGDLTIGGSATFNGGTSFAHTFFGNWIVNTTSATTAFTFTTASTVNFNTPATPAPTSIDGTNNVTITFNDINLNNTSGFTLNKNISFSTGTTPTLTVGNGVTLTPAPGVTLTSTGTITGPAAGSGRGTIKVTRTAATPDLNTQYAITTKTLTNLTVDYDAAAAQTVNGTTYSKLIITSSGTRTLGAAITVDTSLVINGGTLTDGGFQINGKAAGTMSMAANTSLILGTAATATTFPTLYTTGNIALNATSTVTYNSNVAQTISGVPAYGNLTLSATAAVTKTLGTALTVNGTLTIGVNNTLSVSGSNFAINIAGDWTNNGGAFTSGTGTVTFNNTSAAQAITGSATSQTFNNIAVTMSSQNLTVGVSTTTLNVNGTFVLNSGNFTAPATMTITGTATLASGSSFTAGTNLNLGSDWINNGNAATFTPGSGTVTFNSTTAAQAIKGTATSQTFNNLSVTKSAQTLSLAASTTGLTLNGKFTINSGTFDAGTATAVNIAGDWSNSGTFTVGSSVVTFNGSGAQGITRAGGESFNGLTISNSIGTVTMNNNVSVNGAFALTSGTLAIGTNTLTLAGTVSGGGILTSAATGMVSYSQGSNGQTVLAANYGNLTFSNFNKTLPASGTVGIAGTLTTGIAVGHTITGSTIDFNGVGVQTIPLFGYYNLTVSNARGGANVTLASGTINVSGAFSATATSVNYITTGNTVQFNGTSAQSGSGFRFNSLTINNAAGVSISGNDTVNTTLTLLAGNISTGSNKIRIQSGGSVSRTSGHIVGNLEKNVLTGSSTPRFEVGDDTVYTPVDLNFASVTSSGYLTARTTPGDHPDVVNSGIDAAKSVNRYWTLTNDGIVLGANYGVTFNYGTNDVDAAASPNNFIGARNESSVWTLPTVGTKTATSTQLTGVPSFGDFEIGETPVAPTKSWSGLGDNLSWNDPANWSPSGVPTSLNNVSLTVSAAINISTAAACNTITLNNAGLTLTILSGQSLTVSGNLNLTSGTLNTQAAFPTVSGSVTLSGTFGYTAGSGSQTVVARAYNNLTISGGGTKSLGGNITVASDLNVTGGALDLATYTSNRTTTGGTLTIASGALLLVGGSSGGLNNTSNFPSNFSTVTLGGTVDFNGTGSQTIPAFSYTNLNMSGSRTSATVTLVSGGTIGIAGAFSITATGTSYVNTNNTVDFNGTGSQTISAFSYNNLTISGSRSSATVTLANSGTIGVAGTFSVTATGTSYVNTNSTVDFNGSGTQTIPAFGYYNLTSSSTGARTLASSGTVGVAGAFTPGTNSYTITGSTIDFNGSGTQTISAFNYNNLTSSSTGARTLASSGTIGIAGTFTPGTNAYTATGSTINFNGSGSQTISTFAFNHLTISNAGTKSASGNITVDGDLNVSAAILDLGANTANRTALGGTLTVASGATLKVGGSSGGLSGSNFPNNFSTISLSGAIEFSGSGAQTIPALSYTDLTSSSTGTRTLAPSGTIGISGIFTPGTNSYTITGSTIDFSGSGSQTIPAFNYFNLTSSSTGARILASSGTVGIAGTFTPGTNSYTITGSTIDFNGAGSQTINAINYNHLNVSGSGTKTLAGNTTITGNLSVNAATLDLGTNTANRTVAGGVLTVAASATLKVGGSGGGLTGSNFPSNYSTVTQSGTVEFNGSGAQTIPVLSYTNLTSSNTGARTLASSGTINIAGTFTAGTNAYTVTGSTVQFNGSTLQTTSGFTYNNLTMNNASGISISANITVNGTLTFTTGNIYAQTNKVSISSTGSVSRTSGHVIGNFEKYVSTGVVSRTFEIGDSAGVYAPVLISFTGAGVGVAGYLTASTTMGDHPDVANSGVNGAQSVNRYWTVTNSGISFATYSATFNFVAGDVDGGSTTSSFIVAKLDGSTWTQPTVGTRTATSTQATGMTFFSIFQVGESSAGFITSTSTGGNWSVTTSWVGGVVPGLNANVIIATTSGNKITVDVSTQNLGSVSINSGAILEGTTGGQLNLGTAAGTDFNNNGTFNANGITLNLAGASQWAGSGAFNLTVLNINTRALTFAFTSPNTIYLSGAGDPITISTGSLTPGTNLTIEYNGTAAQNITSSANVNFNGLRVTNTAGATLQKNLTATNLTGDLTVTSGGVLHSANGTTAFSITGNTGKTLTVNPNSTLDLGGVGTTTTTFPTGFSTFTLDPTSTVQYSNSSSTAQAISLVQTYGHVLLSGTGAKTIATGTLVLTGNWTNNQSGTLTITSPNTVQCNSSSASETIGGTTATSFNALQVSSIGGVTINTAPTIGGTLTIDLSRTLTLAAGTTTANGSIVNDGTIAVGTNGLTINSSISGSGGFTSTTSGTINYNQSSNGQAVLVGNYGNLTFSNFNKTLPSSGTVGIAGTFTTGSASGHTITGSTIDFNGTGAQTIPAFSYNNLTISQSRTTNDLTLASSGTIAVAGTFTNSASFTSGTYVTSGSTINYNGAAQTVTAFNYNNLVVSGSGTKTLAGTSSFAGDLTISAGTFDLGTNVSNHTLPVGNTLTVAGGTTLKVAGSSGGQATSNFPDNFSSYVLNGTVEFSGNAAQVIPVQTYAFLTTSGSGSKSFAGSVGISNDLIVSSGTLDLGTGTANRTTAGGTLSVASGARLVLGGSSGGQSGSNFPTNYSTITLNGTVEYSGIGAQTVYATPSYTNLDISGASTKSVLSSVTATGNVTVNAGATLSVGGGSTTMSVGGTLANSGTVSNSQTINANAYQNYNSGTPGTTTNTGTITITGASATFDNNLSGAIVNNNTGGIITVSGASSDYNNGAGTTNNSTATSKIVIGNTLTVGTGSFTTSSGEVEFGKGGAQTVPSTITSGTYGKLTLSGSGTKSLSSGTTIVSTQVSLGAGTTLDVAGQTLRLDGATPFTGTGLLVATTINSTVIYNAAGAQDVTGNASYYDLITQNGGTKTVVGGTLTIVANGSLQNNTTLDLSTNSLVASASGITISNAGGLIRTQGSVTFNATPPTITGTFIYEKAFGNQSIGIASYQNLTLDGGAQKDFPSGIVSVSSTYSILGAGARNYSTGTISYNFSGAQPILGGENYNNLTITGAADTSVHKSATSNLIVGGTLTIGANNTLDMHNFAFTTLGSGSNSGKIMWEGDNSHIVPGGGTTEFYGTLTGTVLPGTYGNMRITGTGMKTISGAVIATSGASPSNGVTVTGNLTISATGSLTVTGMDLNLVGAVTNNGTVDVQ